MRIALFGGSFDPPHNGHLAVARAAAMHFSLDRVLLAPTGRQPLKRLGAEAPFSDRFAMVRLLCEQAELLEPSTCDAPHQDGSPNYTVDALSRVRETYDEAKLFAIIGADTLPDLPRWKQSERLFELATWISVSRPQHAFPEVLPPMLHTEQKLGRLHFVANVHVSTSSSALRERLHEGSDVSEELPESVLRYIRDRHLYSRKLGDLTESHK